MQRLQHGVVDHLGQGGAVVGRARLLGQRDQQVARVVGAAEERAVQPFHGRLPHAAAHQRHQPAKDRSQYQPTARAVHLPQEGHAVEQPGEAQRHGNSRQDGQRHQPAANDEVARASAQQNRNLHRPVLDDGIAERERDREEQQNRRHPQPGWHILRP